MWPDRPCGARKRERLRTVQVEVDREGGLPSARWVVEKCAIKWSMAVLDQREVGDTDELIRVSLDDKLHIRGRGINTAAAPEPGIIPRAMPQLV